MTYRQGRTAIIISVAGVIVLAIVTFLFAFQIGGEEMERSSAVETATYQEQTAETSANNNEGETTTSRTGVNGTTGASPLIYFVIAFIAAILIFIAAIIFAKCYLAKPRKLVGDSKSPPKSYAPASHQKEETLPAKNDWAVVGLCLSICSPVFFIVLGPAGLICSIIALKKAMQLNGTGRGQARASIIIVLAVALGVFLVIEAFEDAFR